MPPAPRPGQHHALLIPILIGAYRLLTKACDAEFASEYGELCVQAFSAHITDVSTAGGWVAVLKIAAVDFLDLARNLRPVPTNQPPQAQPPRRSGPQKFSHTKRRKPLRQTKFRKKLAGIARNSGWWEVLLAALSLIVALLSLLWQLNPSSTPPPATGNATSSAATVRPGELPVPSTFVPQAPSAPTNSAWAGSPLPTSTQPKTETPNPTATPNDTPTAPSLGVAPVATRALPLQPASDSSDIADSPTIVIDTAVAGVITPLDSTSTSTNIPNNTERQTTIAVPPAGTIDTAVPTESPADTAVPTVPPIDTAVPTKSPADTAVPTVPPDDTAVPTERQTNTPMPTVPPDDTAVPTKSPADTAVPTERQTNTPTLTGTPTPTNTPTSSPDATNTPTLTGTPAPTNTQAPTTVPINIPLPTVRPTDTLVPTEQATNTPLPTARQTNTPLPTARPTDTLVPTTERQTDTPAPTSIPIPTARQTNTPMPTIVYPTSTPVPSSTAVPPTNTPVPSSIPVPTIRQTDTPVPTIVHPTDTPVPTSIPVPTVRPTDTLVPTTERPTDTPVPTSIPVPTVRQTNTPMPTIVHPTNTPVPSSTAVPPTSTPVPSDAGITPIADAYVRNGQESGKDYAATNYGSDPMLILKDGSDRFDRHAFIKYDLSSIQAPVAHASLKLTVVALPNGAPAPLKLYAVSSEWSEDKITWNNQPVHGALLGEATINAVGEVQFDITDYVNSHLASDRVLSVVLIDDTVARRMIRFWSREGQQQPTLQIRTN